MCLRRYLSLIISHAHDIILINPCNKYLSLGSYSVIEMQKLLTTKHKFFKILFAIQSKFYDFIRDAIDILKFYMHACN